MTRRWRFGTGWEDSDISNINGQDEEQRAYVWAVNASLARLFKHKALRAPQQPTARGSDPRSHVRTLYRGTFLPADKFPKATGGHLEDASYMSFSTKFEVAKRFGGDLLIVLDVNDVEKGTPWVWFQDDMAPNRPHNRVQSKTAEWANESEVVLPPGTLTFLPGTLRWDDSLKKHVVHAKFAPNRFAVRLHPEKAHPRYRPKPFAGPFVRRAAIPDPPEYVQTMYRELFNAPTSRDKKRSHLQVEAARALARRRED